MTESLQYCVCDCKVVSVVNGKQVCRACHKQKMPINTLIIKSKIAAVGIEKDTSVYGANVKCDGNLQPKK